MAIQLLPDRLWNLVEPFIPHPKRYRGGKAAFSRSSVSHGHHIRSARNSMGDAPARDGLWLRHELLATATRLARGGCLATDPFRPAGLAGTQRADRLVTSGCLRQFDKSSFWVQQTGLIGPN
jgi:hypothetical protein